jgi:hypothetical protein
MSLGTLEPAANQIPAARQVALTIVAVREDMEMVEPERKVIRPLGEVVEEVAVITVEVGEGMVSVAEADLRMLIPPTAPTSYTPPLQVALPLEMAP